MRRARSALACVALLLGCSTARKVDSDWYQRVMRLVVAEQYEEALEVLGRVVKENPDNAWAWANRGSVLLNLKRTDDAIQSYQNALWLQPDSPFLLVSMSTALYQKGRLLDSLDWADKALKADPNFAPAMATKARTLKALKRDDEAEVLYKRAFEIDATLKDQFE